MTVSWRKIDITENFGRGKNREEYDMKRRIILQTILPVVMAAAALTACGSSSEYTAGSAASYATADTAAAVAYDAGGDYLISNGVAVLKEMAEEEAVYEDAAAEKVGESTALEQQDALAGRKLIKTVSLNVETEEFDVLVPALEQRVASLGGYIEDMSNYNRGNNYSKDYIGTKYLRYASMTIRIPKENLDTFLSTVAEQSNIVSRSESVTDVTLQYVDLESHKKALLTEQDRLLELMERAETVEDIITIEGRLSEVRYQLESMESQLRTFDNKIDYSTVYLSIDEVEQYSPTEETGIGQRISSGFMESLRGVGRGISNFVIWFIVHLPYIVVWAIIIIAVFLIVRAILKAMARKRARRGAKKVDPYQMQSAGQLNPYAMTGTQQDAQKPQELQQTGSTEDIKEDNK